VGCAAANAARSTGEAGGGEDAATDDTCTDLAARRGAEDPKGAFTSAQYSATTLPPVVGGRGCCPSDWATDAATERSAAGLERVSATTLDWPAM
jgi:hypothetical protein